MARPSPRTQGIDEEGLPFQKYGTQQLVFNPKSVTGVSQVNTGQQFKGFTTSGYTGTKTTAFSQQFQSGITGVQKTVSPEIAREMQEEKLQEMGVPQLPDIFGDLFKPKERCTLDDNKPFCAITQAIGGEVCECPDWFTGKVTDPTAGGRGCECEACKNGTGQCDASAPECDAWDLACIAGTHTTNIVTKPAGDWWDKYGNYVYLILGLIGLGILLWLLRPLFGMIGAFKGGSP